MRVLHRLVFALGGRDDRDLHALAEIEHGRANQVADVLDHEDLTRHQVEALNRLRHHVSLQMAAGTGIDLNRAGAGGANALGIVGGHLIALDDRDAGPAGQLFDGAFEQRRLSSSW